MFISGTTMHRASGLTCDRLDLVVRKGPQARGPQHADPAPAGSSLADGAQRRPRHAAVRDDDDLSVVEVPTVHQRQDLAPALEHLLRKPADEPIGRLRSLGPPARLVIVQSGDQLAVTFPEVRHRRDIRRCIAVLRSRRTRQGVGIWKDHPLSHVPRDLVAQHDDRHAQFIGDREGFHGQGIRLKHRGG
jgi:hypothetical protein